MKSRDDSINQSNSDKSCSSCSSYSSKKSDENCSSKRYSFSKSSSVVSHYYNVDERSVESEVEGNASVVLDTDESAYEYKATRRTPTPINRDHHMRRKRVIKLRSPKVVTQTRPTFDDTSSGSTFESEVSSESVISPDLNSKHHSYMYVSKEEMKRHQLPLNVFRETSSRNVHRIRLNKRIKSRQNAIKFVVTDVESNELTTNDSPTISPKRQKYPRRRVVDARDIPSYDSRGAVDTEVTVTSLNCLPKAILNMANHNKFGITIDLSTEVIEVNESAEESTDEAIETITVDSNTESVGQATMTIDDLPSDVSSS